MEQFFNSTSQSMVTFIRKHRPESLFEIIDAAERYVESRSGWHTCFVLVLARNTNINAATKRPPVEPDEENEYASSAPSWTPTNADEV